MRTIAILLIAAAASGAPAQKASAATVETKGSAEAAEKKALALFEALDIERLSSDPDYAREIREKLDELRARTSSARVLLGIQALRHVALLIEGRNLESLHTAQEILAQQPDAAHVYGTALWAAVYSNEPTAAVAMLEKAVRHVTDAEDLQSLRSQLPGEVVWPILQQLDERKDENGRSRAAEALLILGGDDREAMPWLEGVRGIALEGRVEAGKFEEARKLAATLVDPREVIRLAGAKKYDRLFRGREDADRELQKSIAANDAFTAGWLARDPRNAKAKLARGQHLRSVGKEGEALALLLPGAIERARAEDRDDDAFWIVNEAAYALDALGRHAESTALMEKLLELSFEKNPTLINMAINHGAVLISAGRYRDSVDWGKALEARAEGLASDYGFMWLWSNIACAESLAGNPAGAAPWLAKLAASSDKNESAHTRALLCVNDLDAAEALVLKRLGGDQAENLLIGLHDYQLADYRAVAWRTMAERLRLVLDRPIVAAALAAKGRRLTLPLSKIYWGEI